jgi:transposase InsO family protein
MLSQDELTHWYDRLRLSTEAQTIIDHIRSSDPARRVGGGRRNVTGRYPSKKMGVTIQFESHRVELAAIYEMEHSSDVLEYYDQPQPIKLLYAAASGRRLGVLHTPDFFVLRENSAGWEEWKTEEDLPRLAEHNANRYRKEDERWRCPPGEVYAAQFGLFYRVRSSQEIDWKLQRNVQFLEDYFRGDSAVVPTTIREHVRSHVAALPSITLQNLIEMTSGIATPDQIFFLIADETVNVDLCSAPLVEPDKVSVFPSKDAALGMGRDDASQQPLRSSTQTFEMGVSFDWDGRRWQIANMGEHQVCLLGEAGDFVEVPIAAFEALARQGRILRTEADQQYRSSISHKLRQASERDLKIANKRVKLVHLYLSGNPVPAGVGFSPRTLRRWAADYRSAESKSGNGYIALLPAYAARGNRNAKLPERSQQLMLEFIDKHYENLKQRTLHSVWSALGSACEQGGCPIPSYKTFCRTVHARSGSLQTRKRQGERSAYKEEPFYWELELKTPRHGDRPLEIVHVDHTELDIELRSSCTKRLLGRPWLTLLTDAFSRRVLAFYLTFDPPSYRSCMMILRECVRRNGRLPQILVMDGGREFESIYFEALLARYECLKKTRPPAKARFGSVCERLFGTVNTSFIYNLSGNTQITRNVRQVTKSVDPKEHAIWTLAALHQRLTEYLYNIYDSTTHSALGQSPREAFESGITRTGQRAHRLVAYNSEFLMATLPTTTRGTAKVVPNRGVKINHIFYWCETFRYPDCQEKQVAVRFDPFDAGTAFAFVHNEWRACHSEHYLALRGHSERELMLATEELKRLHRDHSREYAITGRRLADYLALVEAEEVLLKQRLCDSESTGIQSVPSAIEPVASDGDPVTHDDAGGEVSSSELHMAVEAYGEF